MSRYSSVTYSHRELTVKQRTVNNILENAKLILENSKRRGSEPIKICTNAVSKYDKDHLFTIAEANDLIDRVVSDTIYHGGR